MYLLFMMLSKMNLIIPIEFSCDIVAEDFNIENNENIVVSQETYYNEENRTETCYINANYLFFCVKLVLNVQKNAKEIVTKFMNTIFLIEERTYGLSENTILKFKSMIKECRLHIQTNFERLDTIIKELISRLKSHMQNPLMQMESYIGNVNFVDEIKIDFIFPVIYILESSNNFVVMKTEEFIKDVPRNEKRISRKYRFIVLQNLFLYKDELFNLIRSLENNFN